MAMEITTNAAPEIVRNISQIPPVVWDEGNGSPLHHRRKIFGVWRKNITTMTGLFP